MLDLNFKLKNTIPFFKDVPIDQLEPSSIVNANYTVILILQLNKLVDFFLLLEKNKKN
jgi:hypothetical protein